MCIPISETIWLEALLNYFKHCLQTFSFTRKATAWLDWFSGAPLAPKMRFSNPPPLYRFTEDRVEPKLWLKRRLM